MAEWKLRPGPRGELTDIYIDASPDTVATTAFHGWTRQEREAHAKLIVDAVNAWQEDCLRSIEEKLKALAAIQNDVS